jgi:hypothetical protein
VTTPGLLDQLLLNMRRAGLLTLGISSQAGCFLRLLFFRDAGFLRGQKVKEKIELLFHASGLCCREDRRND